MSPFIFKLICLLLTILQSVAQSGSDSQVHIPSYPSVDDSSWSLDLGHDTTGSASQLDSVAFDPTSPAKSDLAAPVAEVQCPASGEIYIPTFTQTATRWGESCQPPAASKLTEKDAPTNMKKKYGPDRPWVWERIWRADDPDQIPPPEVDDTAP